MPHDPVAVEQRPRFLKLVLALQGGRLYRWALKPLLAAGYRDCFRTLYPDKAGFTLPAGAANSRLDYIFAQGSLKERLKSCTVWQAPAAAVHASDHYPVMAIFDV
jgi:exonuclease III